jgi:ADP-heptose:LPS heptosyltransferase
MEKIKKILVVRFSAIGDIVLTTPVIRCLKEQTDAQIDVLTKVNFKTVLENNPYITTLHTIEKSYKEKINDLQSANYDVIIDLQHNFHTWKLKNVLGVKNFAFRKLNVEKWLLVNAKINKMPNLHIVDRYLATAESLGVKNDGKGLDYFIPEQQEVKIKDFIPSEKYIAFVIGAAHATKRLPEAKIISICQKIKHPIVLLGGKDESDIGARIANAAGKHVLNTCGQFNLNQSASWVKQAEIVITHDTGLMHIAAAFAKNIISIWGNTVPDFGMYPYYPKGVQNNISIEVNNLSCRPCSKIGHKECPKGHFKCMNEIDENLILHAVAKFWSVVPSSSLE